MARTFYCYVRILFVPSGTQDYNKNRVLSFTATWASPHENPIFRTFYTSANCEWFIISKKY